MNTDAAPKSSGTRLWVRVLLVVSLAFNLLVIGAVVGFVIKGGPHRPGTYAAHVADSAVGPLTRALTFEDRRSIGRSLRKQNKEAGWGRREHRAAIEDMLVLLQATPFDADAFSDKLNATMIAMQGRVSRSGQALVEHLDRMSDADRLAYADRVREALDRKRK